MQTVNEKQFMTEREGSALVGPPLGIRGAFPVTKTTHSAINEVDWSSLSFGKYISDHLFICHYKNGDWQEPQIVPFQNISLPPTALALHYGQAVFEGMKAFRMYDGGINIFRLDNHGDAAAFRHHPQRHYPGRPAAIGRRRWH
jgi:hypothetical protein